MALNAHQQTKGTHSLQFGGNFIHEPVLDGAFPGNAETLYQLPENPTYYVQNPSQFSADLVAGASTSDLGGGFAQNIQRLAFYAQDSWHFKQNLTLNYGLRYSTTYGLFLASGRSQVENPGYVTLAALHVPLVSDVPKDDRKQIAPRVGFAYGLGNTGATVVRAGFGLYFNDLAQNGWVTAFQGVNAPPGACVEPAQNPGGAENAGYNSGDSVGRNG